MASKRHRGQYDSNHPAPYEISRGKIEKFVKCPACFWLDRVAKVPFPSIPSFNLNSNTDKLLKRDLDKYRGKSSHPIMSYYGYNHLIPFEHYDLHKWESSLHFGVDDSYFNTIHHETNLLIGGGLDDVWIDTTKNILHIVDYKSTSNQSNNPVPVSLDGIWKGFYPDFTDTSKKPHNRQKECLCRREENSVPSSSKVPLSRSVSQVSVVPR